MIAKQLYSARRAKLLSLMQEGIALIPTASEAHRNRDSLYPYRHDSYFYYLTGFPEPEAVLVLVNGAEKKSILFCREKNQEREIWDGFRYGPEAALESFGFDETQPIEKLREELPKLMANQPLIYTLIGYSEAWDKLIAENLNAVRAQARSGVSAPEAIYDVCKILDDLRLCKDRHELSLMRRAAQISSGAHVRAMRATKPGTWEYQIEAELAHEFLQHGAMSPAYSSIVASGPNACVLHYRDNNRQIQNGDLLLIDAGCEYQGYASDITRTFPVNGKFTGPQKDIYELVLSAQLACIDAVKPGRAFHDYHQVADRVITQGLIDLGLLKGTMDEIIEKGEFKQFYMHRAGHWLGMDVHDAGAYRIKGQSRTLEAGMVLTVEPGCYIRPADNVEEKYWHIGVRIEDDILVTAEGNENLTAATPKTITAIEAAMRG